MVVKFFLRAVSSAFLLVFIGIEAAVAAVGVTSGNFDVNPQGAASYSIPISVPPGTAGMEPKLSLRYTSGGGNGLIGVGWSLAGLSSIGRCPATYAQDGFIDGVNFDADDRLCLDGARLVAVSGAYGQNGTEYRTEIEQFVKVRQNGGNLNSGNAWFQVWTKSGLVQEYGRDGNAAFTVPGQGYAQLWSVNRIADTVGNYIDIDYAFDSTNNEHYVERIDYTGNDQAGQPPYNSVRFEYTQTRPDKGSGYIAGGSDKMVSSRRLLSIKTYVQSSVVREYHLSYTPSSLSGHSLLASLQECAHAAGASADCLPPIRFEWTSATAGFSDYPSLEPPFNLRNSDGLQHGKTTDVNGDGLTDFVKAYGSNRKTWLNTVSGGQQSWQVSSAYKLPKSLFTSVGKPRATLMDVNGDGLPDLVEGQ